MSSNIIRVEFRQPEPEPAPPPVPELLSSLPPGQVFSRNCDPEVAFAIAEFLADNRMARKVGDATFRAMLSDLAHMGFTTRDLGCTHLEDVQRDLSAAD